jgi:hypothetical protein
LVQYSAGLKGSHNLPSLSLATPESTGIPSLPADFWNRSLCLANIAGVIMAASCLYNPNNNRGQIVIRALHGLNKLKAGNQSGAGSSGGTPLRIKHSKQVLASPIADSIALRDAVMAPPASPRANSKRIEPAATNAIAGGLEYSPKLPESQNTTTTLTAPPTTNAKVHPADASIIRPTPVPEESPSPARLTPDGSPVNVTNDDGPPFISKYIEPKQIMQSQAKPQENPRSSSAEMVPTSMPRQKKRKLDSKSPLPSVKVSSKTSLPARNSDETSDRIKTEQHFHSKGLIKKARKEESHKKPEATTYTVKASENASTVQSSVTPNDKGRVLPTANENQSKAQTPTQSLPSTETAGVVSIEKRERPSSSVPRESNVLSESDTALVLASLKSPIPSSVTIEEAKDRVVVTAVRDRTTDSAVKPAFTTPKQTKIIQPVQNAASVTPLPACTPRKSATTSATTKPAGHSSNSKSPAPFSKEEFLRDRVSVQYKQLQVFLKNVTEQSMLLLRRRQLQKHSPIPRQSTEAPHDIHAQQKHLYDQLMAEHRASHLLLQKQLLRSAETTLRLLMESCISLEEARLELKDIIKEYEGILYDTLQRQEMERLNLVACHSMDDHPSDATDAYPCQSAFRKVDDICTAITRPVGRPKSGQPPSKA